MAVSERQFNLLKEMGIPLWQTRSSSVAKHDAQQEDANSLTINFATLSKNQLFIDILSSINLSIGEVSCDHNCLNLGLFNWVFSASPDVTLYNNVLTTPSLDELAQSPQLKSLLWQNICEYKIS
ncbi:DNA polymerase III subunit psi [Colwelliaceae bacterium 6471]